MEINGEAYDGSCFMGNLTIFPLIYQTDCSDILIVQINAFECEHVSTSPHEVVNRMNEISFLFSLLRELRAPSFVTDVVDQGERDSGKHKRIRLHRVPREAPPSNTGRRGSLTQSARSSCMCAILAEIPSENGSTPRRTSSARNPPSTSKSESPDEIKHIQVLDELDFDGFRRVPSIHLDGTFLLTRHAEQQLYTQVDGCFFYMGSVHSKLASPYKAPHVSAEHGVRANTIGLGFVRTWFVDKQSHEHVAEPDISEDAVIRDVMLKDTLDCEFADSRDVPRVAVDVAAIESKALKGQSVIVKHGWHMT